MRAERPIALALLSLAVSLTVSCTRFTGPAKLEEGWAVHESGHFQIHVRPGSFASQHVPRFAEVLEDQYAFTLRRLNASYEGQIAAFMHDKAGEEGLQSQRSGTAFPLTDAFRVTAVPPLDDNLLHVINHEANHVVIRNALGRPGTSFVNEGLASALMSPAHVQFHASFDHRWSSQHAAEIPPLTDLVDDEKWSGLNSQMAYKASSSFLAWLLDDGGPEQLRRIYGADSKRFAQAFQAAYGRPLDAAEAAWRAFVRTQAP